ncbi:hypothetical protein LSCM1_07767 [Leishmania martiniquensis]|uniref:Surface antigen-like protein n=1 Tax=Leishmania martiniquensis TaxID=1580590 RepID=A0A836HN02_9TRYP|nr:hypothetical protein LSCM1_07767 [Leishmania martiniquensis]
MAAGKKALARVAALASAFVLLLCVVDAAAASATTTTTPAEAVAAVPAATTITDQSTQYFVKLWSNMYPLKYVWSGKDICKYEGISCDTVKQTVTMLLVKFGITGTIPRFGSKPGFTPSNVRVITMNLMGNPGLTGTFPEHYGQLTWLQELYLMGTSLQGTIPQAWNSLSNLVTLDVSNTKACGNLPAWDAKGLKSLKYMNFKGNDLMKGTVPASLATFGAISFETSGCHFCGCIPVEFSTSIYMTMQLARSQPQMNAADCATANACTPENLRCNAKSNAAAIGYSRASAAAVVASVLVTVALLLS